ncbi:class F sortase [Actinacidiphila acididurans]|uniref:Class F sortase n=1 Tax=Actinacidiphila acididurans TaxID=2784346 RepID=A0ABS2U0C8_9ACTN|nr:class F sortase [Actinacidiphila acididurans]MBM9508782.1 class F sortase [Actinacidiphila acididurans]
MTGPDDEAEPRPDGRTWAALAVGLLLLAAWLLGHGGVSSARGPIAAAPGAARPVAAVEGDSSPQLYPAHAPLPPARPLHLDIASLGLHAGLVGRGLRDGTVDPPPYSTPDVAGWYRDGPAPGAPGAAIIVGHVDTEARAAVFYQLASVQRGALVDITRADSVVAEFTVESVETVSKDHFDADRVYGYDSTGRPELRLITCGGTFDRTSQTYSANVVVHAVLTSSRRA